MAYCNKCGGFIPDGARFCENCGAPVEAQTNNYNNTQNETYAQQGTYYQQPDPQQNYYQPPYQQSSVRPKSSVSFGEAVSMFFRRYVDFSGRSVKSEFWYVFLFNCIVGFVLGILAYKNNAFQVLASIYSLVKQGERAKYLNLDTSNFDGDVMAYINSGEEGLVDYLTARDALDQLGLANNENNRNAVLAALERSGQGSFPDILSNFENNRSRAWHEFDIGGPLHTRYGDFETTFFDDEQYENLANDISSVIRRVEANRAIGYDRDYDGADKAYYNGGVNGLLEYLYPAALLKQSGMENNEKNRQMILDAYTQGGSQAVQQQLNQFSVFSDTGYGPNLSYKYNHATNYLPQLTPTEFADLYGRIDQQNQGESGYNNITQQEVIDFLNQNPSAYNSDTALQYWYAFDGKSGTDDAWKKIPVLNQSTGMWEAQR